MGALATASGVRTYHMCHICCFDFCKPALPLHQAALHRRRLYALVNPVPLNDVMRITLTVYPIARTANTHDDFCLDVGLTMLDTWALFSCWNCLAMGLDLFTYMAMFLVYVTGWRASQMHREVKSTWEPDIRERPVDPLCPCA